ncbi:MAG: DUF4126 family protein, partial [Cyanobacteria bacterium J06606_4]
ADLPTLLQWSTALAVGGGAAGTIQGMTGMTRLATNSATGGCASPVTASLEWMSSVMLSILSLTLPLLALVLVAMVLLFALRRLSKRPNAL